MMNEKGQGNVMEGMVKLIIIITVFAVTYPVMDSMINALQATAGTSVDLISAAYLPIMGVSIILCIAYFLNPARRTPTGYDEGY